MPKGESSRAPRWACCFLPLQRLAAHPGTQGLQHPDTIRNGKDILGRPLQGESPRRGAGLFSPGKRSRGRTPRSSLVSWRKRGSPPSWCATAQPHTVTPHENHNLINPHTTDPAKSAILYHHNPPPNRSPSPLNLHHGPEHEPKLFRALLSPYLLGIPLTLLPMLFPAPLFPSPSNRWVRNLV